MKTYTLVSKQTLKVSLTDAWDFFSSPLNLAKITPAKLNFRILSGFEDGTIRNGLRITYKVSPLFGIPLTWVTRILNVNAPHSFTDEQEKGPYKLWVHTHTFVEKDGWVEMTDDLKYALPFGILGRLMHALLVKGEVERIFSYRYQVLEKMFNSK
jgi:ligand-binding SRPBCC domain-containing protein